MMSAKQVNQKVPAKIKEEEAPESDEDENSFDDSFSPDQEGPEEIIEFWGANVAANGDHAIELELGEMLEVKSAALSSGKEAVLHVEVGPEKYTLCTLNAQCRQYILKLVFQMSEGPVKFTVKGDGAVSLVGVRRYYDFEGDMSMFDSEDDEDDEEGVSMDQDEEGDDEEGSEEGETPANRLSQPATKPAAKTDNKAKQQPPAQTKPQEKKPQVQTPKKENAQAPKKENAQTPKKEQAPAKPQTPKQPQTGANNKRPNNNGSAEKSNKKQKVQK